MKDILESIILNIVDDRDAVSISEKIDGENIVYSVKVANNDMGRVIGKQGKNCKSNTYSYEIIRCKGKEKNNNRICRLITTKKEG